MGSCIKASLLFLFRCHLVIWFPSSLWERETSQCVRSFAMAWSYVAATFTPGSGCHTLLSFIPWHQPSSSLTVFSCLSCFSHQHQSFLCRSYQIGLNNIERTAPGPWPWLRLVTGSLCSVGKGDELMCKCNSPWLIALLYTPLNLILTFLVAGCLPVSLCASLLSFLGQSLFSLSSTSPYWQSLLHQSSQISWMIIVFIVITLTLLAVLSALVSMPVFWDFLDDHCFHHHRSHLIGSLCLRDSPLCTSLCAGLLGFLGWPLPSSLSLSAYWRSSP